MISSPSSTSVVDDREREHRALVRAVAGEGRDADLLAVLQQLVVRPRRVVRERDVDVLRAVALLEQRSHCARDVVAVPRERHLAPRRLGHPLERLAPGEVVVVLDEPSVPELPWRQVVVGDVVRVVAAAERARSLVALRRQPLAVGLHRVAGEDGGQRARDPARLERVRRIDTRADLLEPELLAGLDQRGAHVLALGDRAEQLEPRDAGHAVMQRAHLVAADRDPPHVEELDLGQRAAVRFLEHLHRGRALHLEAVELAPFLVDGGALVAMERHVVVAGLGVVLHPVVRRRAADEADHVLLEVEEDRIADHVAVVVDRRELLRLVDAEVLEGVDAGRLEEPDHVRALDGQVGHVMRLVEQRRRVAPRVLLVAPVRELAGNGRVDVRPDLRVPGEIDRVADGLDQVFETLGTHAERDSSCRRWRGPHRLRPQRSNRLDNVRQPVYLSRHRSNF